MSAFRISLNMLKLVTSTRPSTILRTSKGFSSASGKYVAVILSGSGVYDGSEIHEASATLVHLTRLKYVPQCYAPNINQMHVIDHSKGAESKETRNVLSESARIARGNIKPLNELTAQNVVAAVFPGGFGAAKNLSNFATAGTDFTVNEEVSRIIKELHSLKRPLAFMCIAPVIAARLLPGVQITLGQASGAEWPHCGAVEAAKAIGARVELRNVNEVSIDKTNLVVSTPAFMFDGQYHEMYEGIGNLIKNLDALIKEQNK